MRTRASIAATAFIAAIIQTMPCRAGAQTFHEHYGFAIVEIESAPVQGSWQRQTTPQGFGGSCFYRWTGSNFMGSAPGHDELLFTFSVQNAGTYTLQLHSRHDHPDDGTLENDCWLAVDGGSFYKCFSWPLQQWTWHTRLEYGHSDYRAAQYELSAGTHTIRIQPRSQGFAIDKIALYNGQRIDEDLVLNVRRPESPTDPSVVPVDPGTYYEIAAAVLPWQGSDFEAAGLSLALAPGVKQGEMTYGFDKEPRMYDISLYAIGESVGTSRYRIYVRDSLLGEYETPLTATRTDGWVDEPDPQFPTPLKGVWYDVDLALGDPIRIEAVAGSLDDVTWTRGMWHRLTLFPSPSWDGSTAVERVPMTVRSAPVQPAEGRLQVLINGRTMRGRTGAASVRAGPSGMLLWGIVTDYQWGN